LITVKEVEYAAKLARLDLDEEEKQRYTEQFSKILDHFNQLNEVNTENIEPMAHVFPMRNIMREDKAEHISTKEEILQNAPLEENGFFRVPKI